jgi:hypothetical protein
VLQLAPRAPLGAHVPWVLQNLSVVFLGPLHWRAPASVQPTSPELPKMTPQAVKLDLEFMDSLKRHESEQPKNPHDLQNLIDELKSY